MTDHHHDRPPTPHAPDAASPTDAPISHVAAHPDNPRRHLGDLAELVRSMKAHGVLQPLLVLPANDDGVHLIVAGHRRHAAAAQAGLERVPIVVRDLDRAAVIEAMLIENTSRDDLTISDEVAAIAKLISLDGALTPAKLCKRIGKSQRWVRDRMTITVLPARWIDAISEGRLTLAQAVAAAGAADLGPDSIDAPVRRTGPRRRLGPRPGPHRRGVPAAGQARRRRSRGDHPLRSEERHLLHQATTRRRPARAACGARPR